MTHNKLPQDKQGLQRSATNRVVAGVLGGICEHYQWNVTTARLLFLISFLLPGPQAIFYLVGWLLMGRPEK